LRLMIRLLRAVPWAPNSRTACPGVAFDLPSRITLCLLRNRSTP
jgi:hypothetical protein